MPIEMNGLALLRPAHAALKSAIQNREVPRMAKDNFYIKHRETGLYFVGFGSGPDYEPRWGGENEAKPYADEVLAQAQADLLPQSEAFRQEPEAKRCKP